MAEVVKSARRSPGARLSEEMAAASAPGRVGLTEIPFLTQLGIRAEVGTPGHDAVQRAAGIPLPRTVGEVTGSHTTLAGLWLGPDEFLLVGEEDPGLTGRLVAALAEAPGQVVELSANRSVLQLTGPAARLVLRKSCPADLHPREFGIDHAISTTYAEVPVVLWRVAEETWWVLPRASFTQHVVRWSADAMREFRAA